MKNLIILVISTLSLAIYSCYNHTKEYNTTLRIFDGYIIQDKIVKDVFYLQDIESAALIELKFINEDNSDLSFEDFGHVEVIGSYNKQYNFLVVDQILDTRELLVLEPISNKR